MINKIQNDWDFYLHTVNCADDTPEKNNFE